MSPSPSQPQLWVVGTPIGNLDDLSPRARQIISTADILACEDKRRAGRLCQLAQISRPPKLFLVNEHTESAAAEKLATEIQSGKTVALITDAGMPALSDPGAELVSVMHQAGIKVSVVPGPSSVSAALALSGMYASRYVFEGFLPRRGKKRTQRLKYLAQEERTLVLFESPHRLEACIEDLAEVLEPSRIIFIAKELTKLYESSWKGAVSDAVDLVKSPDYKKGEYVIVIQGK